MILIQSWHFESGKVNMHMIHLNECKQNNEKLEVVHNVCNENTAQKLTLHQNHLNHEYAIFISLIFN